MPSDHHVGDEAALMKYVDLAFAAVEERPHLTLLIGIAPDEPETAYGWIEPAAATDMGPCKTLPVRRFWEKPSREIARKLMATGCLWNSFIVVGQLSTLLGLFTLAMPELYLLFEDQAEHWNSLGGRGPGQVIRRSSVIRLLATSAGVSRAHFERPASEQCRVERSG
jgi:mannose-1-phosphate guanylyltransferase